MSAAWELHEPIAESPAEASSQGNQASSPPVQEARPANGPKAEGHGPGEQPEPRRSSPATYDPGEQKTMPGVAGQRGKLRTTGCFSPEIEVA